MTRTPSPVADVRRNPHEPEFIDFVNSAGEVLRTVHRDDALHAASVPAKVPPGDLNEATLKDALAQFAKHGQKLSINPTYVDFTPYLQWAIAAVASQPGPMHCEHLYAYHLDFVWRKQNVIDAVALRPYVKIANEYRRAARDADYAATFWRT